MFDVLKERIQFQSSAEVGWNFECGNGDKSNGLNFKPDVNTTYIEKA